MKYEDLTDHVFGQLTVIKKLHPQRGRTVKYICKCSCGHERIVPRSNLCNGMTVSCGNHRYNDLKGNRYGRLICIKKGSGYKHANGVLTTWICNCDCGNTVDISAQQLVLGKTRSCGCLRKQTARERAFTGYKDISGKYWSTVFGGAKRRGLEFNITKEYVWDLYESQGRKCKLSGVDILFNLDPSLKTASIDRIDNTIGYAVGNIQIVHKDINIMKNNFDQDKFIDICRRIFLTNPVPSI